MRLSLAGLVLFALISLGLAGTPLPMSLKDMSLMFRSGCSSAIVEQELAQRHFIGTVDEQVEMSLALLGASKALIGKLKSGEFAVPSAKVDAVKAELAAKEQRRSVQAEETRKLNALYQARLVESRKTSPGNGAGQASNIASLVKGELVSSRNGVLRPYLDAELEKKKVIALYRSAYWCAPCRQFTPKLVAFYQKVAAAHPEFEVLFVSNDKSVAAMEGYMRDDQMPWPALNYEKIAGNGALRKYFGESIPCLVVVDENGKVISDTYAGKNYRGPEAVLADLDQLFAGKGPTQIAQTR